MTELITTPRVVVQQALEALEGFVRFAAIHSDGLDASDKYFAEDYAEEAFLKTAKVLPDLRAALEQPNECHWYQDGDEDSDKWAASCGRHRYFQLNDGTPTDNRMKHCCYCGKPLVEVPIEPEDEHD